MEEVQFGPWRLLVDGEATRRAYAGRIGSPESCGCVECRNFAANRNLAYPAAALDLFARLGIDPQVESEIYYQGPVEGGRHSYGGWFHFIGRIEDDSFAIQPVGERFSLFFTNKAVGLVPAAFGDGPVVQLEFYAEVPWVLTDEPPH
jgi:hypothetical protein